MALRRTALFSPYGESDPSPDGRSDFRRWLERTGSSPCCWRKPVRVYRIDPRPARAWNTRTTIGARPPSPKVPCAFWTGSVPGTATAWASGAITDIRIIDGNGPLFLHYDGGELGEGDLGCIVPNAALRRRMFDAVMAAPNIDLRFETGLEALSLSANAAIATLSNGDAVRARLADRRRWPQLPHPQTGGYR